MRGRGPFEAEEEQEGGVALRWVSDLEAGEIKEVIVELVDELMEQGIRNGEEGSALNEFEGQMNDFEVTEFVEE